VTNIEPRKPGRPTDYTPELGERICGLLLEEKSLRQIADMEGMPDKSTILRWLGRHEDFATMYARAKQLQAEGSVDSDVELADLATPDDWQVRKLQIQTRQWRAMKMLPKRYGEKVEVEHVGEPQQTEADIHNICRRLAYLLDRGPSVIDVAEQVSAQLPQKSAVALAAPDSTHNATNGAAERGLGEPAWRSLTSQGVTATPARRIDGSGVAYPREIESNAMPSGVGVLSTAEKVDLENLEAALRLQKILKTLKE